MQLEKVSTPIPGDAPGQEFQFTGYVAGPEDAETTVYLQGATHTDEQPGILILHHFLDLLEQAASRNALNARFRVFPMVNPLGMANLHLNQHQGRYDQLSGVNFNRDWPDVFASAGKEISAGLGDCKNRNIAHVRAGIQRWLEQQNPVTARDRMRQLVMEYSYDADYVFDLHCDDDALIHVFAVPQLAGEMHELAQWIGAAATLLAEDSGGGSFDEVWPAMWLGLARMCPTLPVPMPVKSCTLEYRGEFDVFDALNKKDAENLFGYFQARGLIAGEPADNRQPAPKPMDLRGTEFLRAETPGLLAYRVELGDEVQKGDVIADLIELDGARAFRSRRQICAGTDGVVISRALHKYTWPGEVVAKISGNQIIETGSGYLLSD